MLCINPEQPLVLLVFLGDIMVGRGIQNTTLHKKSINPFSEIQPSLDQADLRLANLESPLTTSPCNPGLRFCLCAQPSQISLISAGRINLLSLENNHRLDCGERGFEDSKYFLQSAGLTGISRDNQPVYSEINGISLVLFAFDDVSTPIILETVQERIRDLTSQGRLVLISIHWGMEYQTGPSPRQKRIAQGLADSGAALIWGHHPHVFQKPEWITGGQNTPAALVLYSLGNTVFDQRGIKSVTSSKAVFVWINSYGALFFSSLPYRIDPNHDWMIRPNP